MLLAEIQAEFGLDATKAFGGDSVEGVSIKPDVFSKEGTTRSFI